MVKIKSKRKISKKDSNIKKKKKKKPNKISFVLFVLLPTSPRFTNSRPRFANPLHSLTICQELQLLATT